MPGLLFLTQRIPYPPTKGEKIRALQILLHLRRSFEVHLGCLVDDPRDLEHVPTVRSLCADSYFATLNRGRAKISCLRGMLTGEALSVAFYQDRGLAAWVARVLREVRPEVVFVSSSNMAPYVLDQPGCGGIRVVDLVDVDSEKWRAYADAGQFPMKHVNRREWRRVAELERRILHECDWSTFVSADEAVLFDRLQPGHSEKIRAVSNGVDHAYFDPAGDFPEMFDTSRTNYVFTGTMDYPPNVEAVGWFAKVVLPILRQGVSDAQFHIVGSSPAPEVMALAAIPGVFVTGRVPDVRPYLAHTTAAVAPMRIARGIQNKVLEAMAMARPVVVTRDALTGIAAVAGAEVLVAETAEEFAAACLHAATDVGPSIGILARERVLRDYVWAERLRGFDALLGTAGHTALVSAVD